MPGQCKSPVNRLRAAAAVRVKNAADDIAIQCAGQTKLVILIIIAGGWRVKKAGDRAIGGGQARRASRCR